MANVQIRDPAITTVKPSAICPNDASAADFEAAVADARLVLTTALGTIGDSSFYYRNVC